MPLFDVHDRLHSDALRQLDEEGWAVSERVDGGLCLVNGELGTSRSVRIQMTAQDGDVVALVELLVNQEVAQSRQLSAPATNIGNLLDVSLKVVQGLSTA